MWSYVSLEEVLSFDLHNVHVKRAPLRWLQPIVQLLVVTARALGKGKKTEHFVAGIVKVVFSHRGCSDRVARLAC